MGVIIGQVSGQPALFTVAQSRTKPNGAIAGPYSNRLQAQAKANSLNGVASSSNPLNTPVNPLTGINAIGDLANRLTQPNTWIRVGEFLAGGVLLVIGLNAMTKGPVRSAATDTARKGAKLGALIAK